MGIGTKFYLKYLTLEYCVDSINQHHKEGCYDNDVRLWPYIKNVIKNLLCKGFESPILLFEEILQPPQAAADNILAL